MATQAERTGAMRQRLLRATVDSLLELGYARTSTIEVCRRARVSRGAHLHHFPTKAELVAAAVEQVFLDRLAEFQRFVERLSNGARPELGAVYEYLWSVYTHEAFYPWLELVVAARTDARLRKRVREVDARFTARAEAFCAAALAGARPSTDDIARVTRLVLSVLDGLATHRILQADDRPLKAVLRLFARMGTRAMSDLAG